jgi:multimeric flavodoxin WrbA
MTDGNSLPGCFTLKKAIPPNQCETCKFADACKKYVAKDRLKPLVSKILEAEAILRGEKI